MKKHFYLLLIGLLALTACDVTDEPESAIETIKVNGVSFNMVKVKGGNVMELCYMPLSGYSFRVYRGRSYFSKYFMWKSVYSSDQGEVRGSDIGLRLAE